MSPKFKFKKDSYPFKNKVRLAPDSEETKFHWFLEHFVYARTQKWKNDPRLNHLAIRAVCIVGLNLFWSIFIVTVIFALLAATELLSLNDIEDFYKNKVFIPDNVIKFFIGFVSACSITYWKISDLFRQQWHYCQSIYNDMLKHKSEPVIYEALANSLAIDLVVVDLWAHRSFRELFAMALWEAIFDYADKIPDLPLLVSDVNAGNLPENKALYYLELYQTRVLNLEQKKEANSTTSITVKTKPKLVNSK